PGWQIVYLPFIIVVTLAFLMADGFTLSYFFVFVCDFDIFLLHIIRLFFYSSPLIWVGVSLPLVFRFLVDINPILILVDAYWDILMYHQSPDFIGLFIILSSSIIVLILMVNYYRKNEHKIIKAL